MFSSFECMELLLKLGCFYLHCMDNEGKEKGAIPNQILYWLNSLAHAAKEGDTRFHERLIEASAHPKLLISVGLLEPIEHAAMANNLEGVEILFPRTEWISRYKNCSVDGIITYCHSEETKTKSEMCRSLFLDVVDEKCKSAAEDNIAAIVTYTDALVVRPSNRKWLANRNRSLCFTRMGRGVPALRDAEECVRLSP